MDKRKIKKDAYKIYVEKWGQDWVNAHRDTICDSYTMPNAEGNFDFCIEQDDSLEKTPVAQIAEEFIRAMSTCHNENAMQHRTSFHCNANSGKVEIFEHV